MPSRPPAVISADELAALLLRRQPHVLLDARFTLNRGPLRAEYEAGHIPGGVFVDLEREVTEIRQLVVDAGVDPDRELAVYCGGGIASGWAAYVLRSSGIDAALFAPSWSEYARDTDLPVETG